MRGRLRTPDPYFIAGAAAVLVAVAAYLGVDRARGNDPRQPVTIAAEAILRLDSLGMVRRLGSAEAEVTVVEFIDYQCPACAASYERTRALLEGRVAAGRVQLLVVDFLTGRYANSLPAAILLQCVAESDSRFPWPLHGALLNQQQQWSRTYPVEGQLLQMAGDLGADRIEIRRCLEERGTAYAEAIMREAPRLRRLGVGYVPFWLLDGRETAWQDMQAALDSALSFDVGTDASGRR